MNNSSANYKILIIDDDKDLSMIVQDMYEDYGYQVTLALDSEEAYRLLETNCYHMILLDINLPRITGFEICRELRKISTIPIIFASARTSEDDRVTGLDIGGDDFLPKPYSLKELLSRTNSILRRTYGFEEQNKILEIGKDTENVIRITTSSRTVTRNGQTVSLSQKEFDLLKYLAEHKNEAQKKEAILRQVWGTLSEVELSTLTVHIRWLREKLEVNPSQPCYLKTVWGVGYLLEDEA